MTHGRALTLVASVVVSTTFLMMRPADAVWMFGGNWSCGVWLNARSVHRSQYMEGWVAGYLSAANWAAEIKGFSDILIGTDDLSAYVWIDSWCKAHPLDDVRTAANGLADYQMDKRGKKSFDPAHK
jgi:hypothetical protein